MRRSYHTPGSSSGPEPVTPGRRRALGEPREWRRSEDVTFMMTWSATVGTCERGPKLGEGSWPEIGLSYNGPIEADQEDNALRGRYPTSRPSAPPPLRPIPLSATPPETPSVPAPTP